MSNVHLIIFNVTLGHQGIRKLRNVPEPEPKPVDLLEDEDKQQDDVEMAVENGAESKTEDDADNYDLYDFLKDGNEGGAELNKSTLSTNTGGEPEDGEVEDV